MIASRDGSPLDGRDWLVEVLVALEDIDVETLLRLARVDCKLESAGKLLPGSS